MNKDKIHITARAVVIENGHILLIKTTDLPTNFYFMPGGHIEHNETAEAAILRELLEETGSKAKLTRMVGLLEYIFEPGHSSICHNHEYGLYFEAQLDDIKFGQPLPQLEPKAELVWMKLEELKNIDFRPEPLVELLPKWLAKKEDNAFFSKTVDK